MNRREFIKNLPFFGIGLLSLDPITHIRPKSNQTYNLKAPIKIHGKNLAITNTYFNLPGAKTDHLVEFEGENGIIDQCVFNTEAKK